MSAAANMVRREFLKRGVFTMATATASPLFVRSTVLGWGRAAPSEHITVAFIGVGWKGLQGCFGSLVQSFLLPAEAVPGHIDWELWLGPAPWRPYHSQLVDKGFRPFRDYSGGGMTDWGCHEWHCRE
ncbi:MAG: hypothetical protein ACYC3X_30935 [Pirellulaceae bacterium]